MAFEARRSYVFTFQRPAGIAVIEAGHRATRPTNELGVAAQVLDVALLAWLAFTLFAVPALASSDLRGQVFVTAQASRRRYFFAGFVTFGAIVVGVEIAVGRAEFAWRQQLGVSIAR